ncbi:MAG TPA: NADH-quinone oxidoreductase subunit F [Ruminococcaceae bacterium]|nr:NADH-quinone oxidoreductase subunit F [Oscillospiraceae bacterium]
MRITVGKGSCGIAAGALEIFELLKSGASEKQLDCPVTATGCVGMCYLEPIVNIIEDDGFVRTYVKVNAEAAGEILKSAAGEQNRAEEYAIADEDAAGLKSQSRVALKNCGIINPESIDEYLAQDGYAAARKCIGEMTPERVIEEVKISGIGGRGGAGFPTWFKWNAARASAGEKKYVICNADEGDPGAFMDRALIEGDPHAVIEGMLIAAYAIGSDEGVVYVRAEYPLAIERLEKAIGQAKERGFLGKNIFGGGFSFNLRIKAGAGAFVCGEETALIASLEGERGMPRLKPPFPAQKGFWGKPSNINNVETYANIPWIMRNGGAAFSAMGTESSKGTKVFALTGKIAKGGLVEAPMGGSIREVIFGVGGGIKDGKAFKAVQMGGPSGGCIPAELSDTLIDYRALAETGAIMGSGGMVVMDETTCMVDMARFFLDFTCRESCGKCVHCRIGTRRMLEIMERICDGKGADGDIEQLTGLADEIKNGALCALGQTAPNPVLTTLRYFKNEYEDHIYRKKCTAHACKALLSYEIDAERCTGCTLCARKCPADAISGERKLPHKIDMNKCIKCGKCAEVCRFDAVAID